MKRNIRLIVVSLFFLSACGDFFPRKKTLIEGVARTPVTNLPEKAEKDVNACAYPKLEFSDARKQLIYQQAVTHVCPRVEDLRYFVNALRLATEHACRRGDVSRYQRELESHFTSAVTALEELWANPNAPLMEESGRLAMEIYTWPGFNRQALSAEWLKADREGLNYSMNLSPARKGFAAIEALLFNRQAEIPPGPNGRLKPEEEAFNRKPPQDRQAARCYLLKAFIQDAAVHSETLYERWHQTEGAFPNTLQRLMDDGQTQMLLNEISDGLFYLERVKDLKLGLPLGLNARCRQDTCPDQVEWPHSQLSVLSLKANLHSFKLAIMGHAGVVGFSQLLNGVGRGDLAKDFESRLGRIESLLNEVEASGPLATQVQNTNKATCTDAPGAPSVCRLFFELRQLMIVYKTDFMTALNLQPPRTDGDND